MLRRLARFFLVAAFIAAQTASVAHQAWHDAGEGKAPQKSLLCDFHTALSAVLGAIDGTAHAVAPSLQTAIAFAAADASTGGFSLLAPRSRAPPAVL